MFDFGYIDLRDKNSTIMVSNYTSLKDFVYPIPICQPEADLGSVLNIFQHLNCKILAIPQRCGGWGIINAEDLLSLIAEIWLGKQMVLASHPRQIPSQQNIAHVTTQNFDSLIKPAMVYQADTKIDEFLNHLQYASVLNNQSECLIVNELGELQGRLDKIKVINHLAHESKHESKDLSSNTLEGSNSLTSLRNLIDAIALPLKIKTVAGEDLYQNKCWQQLITENSCSPATVSQTTIQQGTGERGQQRSPIQPDHKDHHEQHHNDPISVSSLISKICSLDSDPERSLTNAVSSSPNQNLTPEKLNENDSSHAIEIERTADWNYLKFPLVAEPRFSTKNTPYWLVLGTKAAFKDPSDSEETSSSQISETVTSRLLATVSHELKSPLTGIVGLSSLLQEQKLGQLNQRQARYVKLIHSSGQKMVDIVENLLKLTSLATEELLEPELINLEFLCRQLYQQALAKVKPNISANSDQSSEHKSLSRTYRSFDGEIVPDLVVAAAGIKLHIELGSEMAIANKSILSGVLSHLILETIRVSESLENLNIKIRNLSGLTAISISSNRINPSAWSSISESSGSSLPNSGLDLIIAEYLAKFLQGSITSNYSSDCGQFTLLLPKKTVDHHQLSDNETTTPSNLNKTDNRNVTILCLYPESEVTIPDNNHDNSSNFDLKSWSDDNEQQVNYQHRIIEADSLEQAHTLARIWQLDVIVLDSYQIVNPAQYLRSLQESEYLAALPLITLDTKTTEAANQIEGLKVYPCLLPAKHCRVEDLMQVIQIATET